MGDRETRKRDDAVKTLERLGYDYYDIGGHTDWYLDCPEDTATPTADAELAEELDCVASELATYQSDNAATVSRAAAALRARQPAQAVAVPEVWIAHDGGKCPLPAGVLVETRWRNGREFAAEDCRPDGEAWSWPPSSTDADNIVAYRLAASKGGA